MKLVRLWWWRYVLFPWKGFRVMWCRAKGHAGVIWYNPNGLEPDMHCKQCGEDLG